MICHAAFGDEMVWHRPVIRTASARTWQRACEQFAAAIAERDRLKFELEWTEKQLADTRQTLRELQAVTLERTKAYFELRHLQRERDIVRARNAVRDLSQPVH